MNDLHRAYLNVGSNIQAEVNLPTAVEKLGAAGTVGGVSTVWESRAVGAQGPNFLNVCLLFTTEKTLDQMKQDIIRPIETGLGRVRDGNPNAPRTIDIDVVMWDGDPLKPKDWSSAYTLVPMAELLPEYRHPATQESLSEASRRIRKEIWIIARPDVLGRSTSPA